MWGILIFIFINKYDWDVWELFDLMNEIEEIFGIEIYLMDWLIGMGCQFMGVYDCYNYWVVLIYLVDESKLYLLLDENGEVIGENLLVGEGEWEDVLEGMELIFEVGSEFLVEKVVVGD